MRSPFPSVTYLGFAVVIWRARMLLGVMGGAGGGGWEWEGENGEGGGGGGVFCSDIGWVCCFVHILVNTDPACVIE